MRAVRLTLLVTLVLAVDAAPRPHVSAATAPPAVGASLGFETLYHNPATIDRRTAEIEQRIAERPDDPELRVELGRTYLSVAIHHDPKTLEQAEAVFAEVLERQPDHAVALAYHGLISGLKVGFRLARREEIPQLVEQNHRQLDRAVALAPDSIEVRLLRAYDGLFTPSYFGRDRLTVDDLREVVRRLDGGAPYWQAKAHTLLGDAYVKIELPTEAKAAYERAVALQPGTGVALEAEARLRNLRQGAQQTPGDVQQLVAFFGFLIGTAIFAVLFGLVTRDLLQLRRRRGMLASLAVALAGLVWNTLHLLLVILAAVRVDLGGWEWLAEWSRSKGILTLALAPIPLGLVTAYRFYKASFMDIILKQGIALATVTWLSRLYYDLALEPLNSWFLRVGNDALQTAFFTLPWLVLYAAYPPIRDFIYRQVDRFVFRRRDYAQLLDELNDRLSGVTDQQSLVATVNSLLGEAFRAEPVKVLAASDPLVERLAREVPAPRGEAKVAELGSPLGTELEEVPAELVVMLRTGNALQGAVLIGPRALGQSFLSEELSVVRSMASQIARTWESLRLREERHRQELEEQALRKLTTEAKLEALRAQINPHFFFNALNSVASLIAEDPKAAESLLEDLGELFRQAFRPRRELVRLSEELELTETYLKIEKIRLGEKLRVETEIGLDPAAVKIPALTLQPLVENAVKHGIERTQKGGRLRVAAAKENGCLELSVADSGAGATEQELDRFLTSGVGLANVDSRLRSLYGDDARLQFASRPGRGTTVSFRMPLVATATADA